MTAKRNDSSAIVIGAGMTGILLAIRLRGSGIGNVLVREKAADLGGTWRENTYPGIACDVPAHGYTYSFEPNPESQTFAPGPEIQAYFEGVAKKYEVLPSIRFYILSEPDSFLLRTLTRMGTQERQLAGPAIQIFLSNMGKALAMFSWSDGEIWVVSVPGYPALGIISGALFYLGAMVGFTSALPAEARLLRGLAFLILPMLILAGVALQFSVRCPRCKLPLGLQSSLGVPPECERCGVGLLAPKPQAPRR